MAGLTEQQKKALALDKHISVTASAGSGKTRVLVERYVESVRSGAGVDRILCLTFTEKAALELRQKIVQRINSELSPAGNTGPEVLMSLRNAKKQMLDANISTIHSFCSQVLREFPVEAEIDANFKVLEDFDASSLKEEACDEAIRESLADERPGSAGTGLPAGGMKRVNDLLVRIGYRKTLGILVSLLDDREKIEHIKLSGRGLVIDEESVREHWVSLARAVAAAVQENVKFRKADISSDLETLKDAAADDRVKPDDLLEILSGLLQRILTQDGTPRKREVSVEDGASRSAAETLSVLRAVSTVVKDSKENGAALSDYVDLLKTLLALYELSDHNYARKKYSVGAVDFDDLQILTLRLLREKESVRNTLRSRFTHVMVDEFQDTNFLQYDIFTSLLGNFAGDARLFVVGDPKQSIYRFRNAQVEVSKKAEEDLLKLASGASVSLLESFRMNSDIAGFVNAVFEKAMSGDNIFGAIDLPVTSQTAYKPLIPHRPGGAADSIEIFISQKSGRSESEAEEEASADEGGLSANELQAVFTASRIRAMIDSGETVKTVKTNEQPRPVAYGDIAILLRTRSRLPLLEEALSKYGVPYVVSSGIGFYSSQEIFDLTNYLKFLLDNDSDISLLTVLRSPFFGISENELYRMSLSEGATLFRRLLSLSESHDAGDSVRYAANILSEEIQLAQRLTIPQLINRILERTGWLGAYRLSPTANQRIANLRKLLGIAREFEGRGFNNLFDFVERIKYLKETAREGQAPVEEAVDAVKIMTVHTAKGLEFPVVFVPFCDATSNRSRQMVINDAVGILPFVRSEVPPSLSLYKRLESMNEQAEITRLFYVACTRAMDKLILTTSSKKPGSISGINSFTDVLSRTFDLSMPPASGYLEFPSGKILMRRGVPVVPVRAVEEADRKREVGEVLLTQIPAGTGGEFYSATLLQTFKLCPTKYFLRYRLGMPSIEMESVPKGHSGGNHGTEEGTPGRDLRSSGSDFKSEEYDDTILSTAKGSLVHSVLERILAVGRSDEGAVADAVKLAMSAGFGRHLSEADAVALKAEIFEDVGNALKTLEAVGADGKKYLEQTITRRFGQDFLTGTLDLLVEDEKGFHVFDYKTNRLDKPREEIYAGYEIQMKLYALLCRDLKPGQNEFDVTIIFTREPGNYLRKVYSGGDLSDFEEELRLMVQGIKSAEVEAGTLPDKSLHCGECEYFAGNGTRECLMKNRSRK